MEFGFFIFLESLADVQGSFYCLIYFVYKICIFEVLINILKQKT